MTHYEDVSLDALYDAMVQIAQEAMAAGFAGSKSIDGLSIDDWAANYIRESFDENFGTEED